MVFRVAHWQISCVALALLTLTIATAPAAEKPLDEIAAVVVSGEKPTRKPSDLISWLRRLVGQYTYDGHVDLGGKGNPADLRPVKGIGDCVAFGVAPGVQCEINVRWQEPPPGSNGNDILAGASALTPAMILYLLEPDEVGIRYLQVNSTGIAEGATGFIIGDTATFKTPCVNTSSACQRITHITAKPDSKVIDMQVDTEVDYQVAARFSFVLHRLPPVKRGKAAGAPR